jgi:ABC-type phosphate transport system permease subunit
MKEKILMTIGLLAGIFVVIYGIFLFQVKPTIINAELSTLGEYIV